MKIRSNKKNLTTKIVAGATSIIFGIGGLLYTLAPKNANAEECNTTTTNYSIIGEYRTKDITRHEHVCDGHLIKVDEEVDRNGDKKPDYKTEKVFNLDGHMIIDKSVSLDPKRPTKYVTYHAKDNRGHNTQSRQLMDFKGDSSEVKLVVKDFREDGLVKRKLSGTLSPEKIIVQDSIDYYDNGEKISCTDFIKNGKLVLGENNSCEKLNNPNISYNEWIWFPKEK